MSSLLLALSTWTLILGADGAPVKAGADAAVYKQTQNIVYTESHGVGLVLDVFEPTGKRNGVGIVDVASGAFHSDRGKIEDHRRAKFYDEFCSRGFTVFAVRPGSVTKFTLPEMFDNVKQGVRWVKAHAKEYQVDPDRLGIIGASAGGMLCCLTALKTEAAKAGGKDPLATYDTKVKAACAFFPGTDLLHFGKAEFKLDPKLPVPMAIRPLLFPNGWSSMTPEKIRETIAKNSPIEYVSKDSPPFLLIHGDADPLVPLQQSEVLHAALQKQNVPSQLIVKKGGAHPWPTIAEEVAVAADWFQKQLVDNSASAVGQ